MHSLGRKEQGTLSQDLPFVQKYSCGDFEKNRLTGEMGRCYNPHKPTG